jgi:hypothetical protein
MNKLVTIKPFGGGWQVFRGEQSLGTFANAHTANGFARRECDGCGQPEGSALAFEPEVLHSKRRR